MAAKPRWVVERTTNGIWTVHLNSWRYFYDFVRQEMLDFPNYLWRGQANAAWPLESSLDRELSHVSDRGKKTRAQRHLESFKLSARGRRGPNPPKMESENDWWALGQHQGLKTPLLDWTESPFVALYFAFFDQSVSSNVARRVVWAIHAEADEKNDAIKTATPEGERPKTLEIFRPQQDENARLVNQAGLFTRAPLGASVDQWIRENYEGESEQMMLIKITMPNSFREDCLRALNRMNVNHQTLFPDLFGSAEHCNTKLRIDRF